MNVKLLDLQAQYGPIREEVRRALDEVFDQQSLVLGPHVEKFEKNLAEYCGVKHAIGVSSGSDALLCSLMALGIKPGDEVICPSFTFFATAGAIARVGGKSFSRRSNRRRSISILPSSPRKSRPKPGRLFRSTCLGNWRISKPSTRSRPSTI